MEESGILDQRVSRVRQETFQDPRDPREQLRTQPEIQVPQGTPALPVLHRSSWETQDRQATQVQSGKQEERDPSPSKRARLESPAVDQVAKDPPVRLDTPETPRETRVLREIRVRSQDRRATRVIQETRDPPATRVVVPSRPERSTLQAPMRAPECRATPPTRASPRHEPSGGSNLNPRAPTRRTTSFSLRQSITREGHRHGMQS